MTKRGSLLLAVVVGPIGFVAGMTLAERPEQRPSPLAPPAPVTSSTRPEPTGLATFSTLASLPPDRGADPQPALAPEKASSGGAGTSAEAAYGSLPVLPGGADPLRESLGTTGPAAKRAQLFAQLAEVCEQEEFPEEAARFRRAALALDPSDTQLIRQLAENDPAAAMDLLLALLRSGQPAGPLVSLLVELDPAAARGPLLAALDASPSDVDLLNQLAELDPAAARARVELALRINPEDTSPLHVLARIDPASAATWIEGRLREEPGDLSLLYALCDAYEGLGTPGAAVPRLEAALAATEDPDEQLSLIELLSRSDASAAVARWEALGKPQVEDDPYSLRSLSLAYLRAGRAGEGLALARQIIELENAMDGGSDFVSSLLEEAPTAGLQLARSLLLERPDDMDLRIDLLYALEQTEQKDEASRLALRWVEEATSAAPLRTLSEHLSEMELPGDVHARALTKLYRLDPRSVEPLRELIDFEHATLALQLMAPQLSARPSSALRYLVRSGLHSVAESEPTGVVAWLDRFAGLPLQRDVDYLMELAESAASGEEGGVRVARAILARALLVASPQEAEDLRERDEELKRQLG